MKLVLLPGMDGTGELFYPLLEKLPLNLDIQVITFSKREKQSYSELSSKIKQQLPTAPFVLVAESFSGILAYRISLDNKIPLQKLILIATFLQKPRPVLLRFLPLIPHSLMFSSLLPSFLYQIFCLGHRGDANLLASLKASLKHVDKSVLANRLRLISGLDFPSENSKVETLIINPLKDRLVPKSVSSRIQSRFADATVKEVDGPHFISQVCAEEVSVCILGFIDNP